MSLPSKLRVAGFAGGMVGKVRKAVMDSAGIQAHCPQILLASRALSGAPAKSGLLGAELRGLVQLRAAQMVRCPF